MASIATPATSERHTGFASASGERVQEPVTRALVWMLIVLSVAFAFLYTSLFSLAGTPHLRSGDEDFFWTYAARLLSGQVFLKDFHQFTPPGADLAYAAVFRWFGASVCSIDWTIVGLGVALALLCFWCARKLMRADMAGLAALACVVVLYGDRMDATHHWLSSLANLAAVLVLMRGSSRLRIAMVAGLVAVAAFFTQTAGVVGLLACCTGLWWERRLGRIAPRTFWLRAALLAGVTFCTWLLLSWRFLAQAGVENYWFEQVAYLPRDANFPDGFLFPHFSASLHVRSLMALGDHVLVYLLLLTVCPCVAWLCLRRRIHVNENSMALILLAALGTLQTFVVISALNWNRMAAVSMPAVILGIWLMQRRGSRRRTLAAACWCVVVAMILVQSGATLARHFPRVKLPAGDALVEWDNVEEISWLAGHTRPGDDFFEVANTRLYVPLGVRNPTPTDALAASPWTLPQWVNEAVHGLETSRTRYVLWEPHAGIGLVEERHRDQGDPLDPLRAFLQEKYVRAAVFANGDEVWERKY